MGHFYFHAQLSLKWSISVRRVFNVLLRVTLINSGPIAIGAVEVNRLQ